MEYKEFKEEIRKRVQEKLGVGTEIWRNGRRSGSVGKGQHSRACPSPG